MQDTNFKAGPLLEPLPALDSEQGFEPLRVEGRIPAELIGTYVQNGPANWSRVDASHWFDGLGALRAVRLGAEEARGALRFIHSPTVDEHIEGRAHHMAFAQKGGVRERLAALFGASPLRNLANVNVTPHRRELLALMEGTLPVEVGLDELDSRGETDLGGVLRGALHAHFHRVPSRQTTYFVGERIGPRVYLDLYAFPDQAPPQRLCEIRLPGVTELHDFAVTEHHAIVVLTPLWTSSLKMLWRGSYAGSLEWQPERGTEIVMISLDDGAVSHRFITEPFFFWHVAKAWERDGDDRIELDLIRYPDFASSVIWQDPDGPPDRPYEPSYVRGTLDPRRGQASWEERWRQGCEFPRSNPRFDARPSRYCWMAAQFPENQQRGWWDRLVCFDNETGDVDWKTAGERCAIGEPEVVPRGEDERDVWIMALVWDVNAGATHLAIWDGASAEEQPIGRVWYDRPVPLGLHGCWIPGR